MFNLIDLEPKKLEYMLEDNIVMIDVRREDEWIETGIIKNVHTLTFFDDYGNHDIINWLKKLEQLTTSKNATIVLICAHANRTRMIGNYLIQQQGYTCVSHLFGGMELWLKEGRPVEKYIKKRA